MVRTRARNTAAPVRLVLFTACVHGADGRAACTQCFSWKKQIVKLRAQAKKTAAANKKPESNLHV
jgi:hypothetical protein